MTQTDFWSSGTGKTLTGNAQDAFLADFGLLPNNTIAQAMIKSFKYVDKEGYQGAQDRFFLIQYKLIDGDFKGREVSQKIKCFDGKPESIDRNLNLLKLIMILCDFKPSHNGKPTDDELAEMNGKVISIKIREWHIGKDDGTIVPGNSVAENYEAGTVETETGLMLTDEQIHRMAFKTTKPKPYEPEPSALSRNKKVDYSDLSDDIPF